MPEAVPITRKPQQLEGTMMKKVKEGFLPNRRQVLKAGLIAGAGMMMPWRFLPAKVFAAAQDAGMGVLLSDPAFQPKFINSTFRVDLTR